MTGVGFFEQLAQYVRLRRYKESYYALMSTDHSLIASYMDESFDMKPRGVFAVGGIIGKGVPIFELERKWEKLLKRADIDIEYFKASECERGSGQFAKFVADPHNISPAERAKLDSISHEFLEAIIHPVAFDDCSYLCIQGIGVLQEEFYEVIKDDKLRAVLGESPYRLAYDLAMIQCAYAMKELEASINEGKKQKMDSSSSKEPICFLCDEDEEHSDEAPLAYRNLKKTNPAAAEYMASFGTASCKTCAPLQAADAAIFEVRRALNIALKQWPGVIRKQFNLLADARVMFLITHTQKEQLLYIAQTHEPGEPFRLDVLMEMKQNENIKFNFT